MRSDGAGYDTGLFFLEASYKAGPPVNSVAAEARRGNTGNRGGGHAGKTPALLETSGRGWSVWAGKLWSVRGGQALVHPRARFEVVIVQGKNQDIFRAIIRNIQYQTCNTSCAGAGIAGGVLARTRPAQFASLL